MGVVTSANTDGQREIQRKAVVIVLYFDESYGMTTDNAEGASEKSAYQILCKAINELHKQDLFTVFLSTSSNLSSFSPSQRLWWSARARKAPVDGVQSPFVELPFDTWKEAIIVREGTETLTEVCETGFMARFGRPL